MTLKDEFFATLVAYLVHGLRELVDEHGGAHEVVNACILSAGDDEAVQEAIESAENLRLDAAAAVLCEGIDLFCNGLKLNEKMEIVWHFTAEFEPSPQSKWHIDWLSVEFTESGWYNVDDLTYSGSSGVVQGISDDDPFWLTLASRFRNDAFKGL